MTICTLSYVPRLNSPNPRRNPSQQPGGARQRQGRRAILVVEFHTSAPSRDRSDPRGGANCGGTRVNGFAFQRTAFVKLQLASGIRQPWRSIIPAAAYPADDRSSVCARAKELYVSAAKREVQHEKPTKTYTRQKRNMTRVQHKKVTEVPFRKRKQGKAPTQRWTQVQEPQRSVKHQGLDALDATACSPPGPTAIVVDRANFTSGQVSRRSLSCFAHQASSLARGISCPGAELPSLTRTQKAAC